ncbi:MAG: hypothetical protein WD061_01045 [Candidatus Saccharimonadales bacterium]
MNEIILHYPNLKFAGGSYFVWSPKISTIFFDESEYNTSRGRLALLHEIGHAELEHSGYSSDISLLNMEIDAWDFAADKAEEFGVFVDEAHIDMCLETYRIWLYKRSKCPECGFHGVQKKPSEYFCFMCKHSWIVAKSLSLQPHRFSCNP